MTRATPTDAPAADARTARIRDADRSREAILDAAEGLFASRGYDGVALAEVAAAAGLSRGTPSYFFGAKAGLYAAMLERAFGRREQAVRQACAPVVEWAQRDGDRAALRRALTRMTSDYLGFLIAHPAFVSLVMREGLDGGQRLRETPHESQAMGAMFAAVDRSARRRRLGSFRVGDAVLLLLGLTFAAVANRDTYMARLDLDLGQAVDMRRHVALVVDQLMALILGNAKAQT
ncbi:MAG TPA: TetR family transcriptional regulator [Solirubrobacteraceae bacterium]|jgi:AcrR family transcriptional regulator